MTKLIKAITVDPYLKMITESEIENSLEGFQHAIGDHFIELVRLDDNQLMYVDSEGLFRENQQFFVYNKKFPFAGKAIIFGDNGEGGSIDTKYIATDVAKKVDFHSVEEIQRMRLG